MKHVSARATRSLNYLRHTLFSSTSFVKSAAYNSLIRLNLNTPLLCSIYILQKTLKNLKQFNDVLHVGCVVVGGIPTLIIGLNLLLLVFRFSTGPHFVPGNPILL